MSGHIYVLIGPSGAGKTTLATAMGAQGLAERVVTWTTRPPRPDERPNVDYVFVSPEEFQRAFDQGLLAEREQIYQTWYGTPVSALKDAIAQGKTVVLSMGLGGAQRVRELWPQHVTLVAVLPPDLPTLYQRLQARGTDAQELARRWPHVEQETQKAQTLADHIIVNAVLNTAVGQLARIVESLRCSRSSQWS
jgi:guanylate kinase